MNKYVKEASDKLNKSRLPETLEEFSLLHQSDASRVPMAHITRLRQEHNDRLSKRDSNFIKKDIKWD